MSLILRLAHDGARRSSAQRLPPVLPRSERAGETNVAFLQGCRDERGGRRRGFDAGSLSGRATGERARARSRKGEDATRHRSLARSAAARRRSCR
eukprot:scaffold3901_cov390-Prasinococcus_capsulatus_cf.AAC.10